MNNIVIIGRLTRDPELRQTSSGVAMATFTVAVDRDYTKDGERETDFIPVVTWRKLAENCASFLGKGRMVAVRGSLNNRKYEAKDGGKRTVSEITASDVKFLSPKDDIPKTKPTEKEFSEMTPIDEIPF